MISIRLLFFAFILLPLLNFGQYSQKELLVQTYQDFDEVMQQPRAISSDYDKAIAHFNNILSEAPNHLGNTRERLYLTILHHKKGDTTQSLKVFESIFTFDNWQDAIDFFDEEERIMLWFILAIHFKQETICEAIQELQTLWEQDILDKTHNFITKYKYTSLFGPIRCRGKGVLTSKLPIFAKFQKCLGNDSLAIRYLSLHFWSVSSSILTPKSEDALLLQNWIKNIFSPKEILNCLEGFDLEKLKIYNSSNKKIAAKDYDDAFHASLEFVGARFKLYVFSSDDVYNELKNSLMNGDVTQAKKLFFRKFRESEFVQELLVK